MTRMLTREMAAQAVGRAELREAELIRDKEWLLLEAAAVCAYFDLDTLAWAVREAASQPGALAKLFSAAVVVRDEGGSPRWMLRDDVRRTALARLVRDGRLRSMVELVPAPPVDVLQRRFRQHLLNPATAPGPETPLPELRALARVTGWLDGIMRHGIDTGELQRAVALSAVLQPFQQLAGEHFRGREGELRQLRRYVDALPAQSWLGRARQRIESIVRERLHRLESPPLMVYGPGGMGKSSLIARFILSHVGASRPVSFVYIDFDRPGVSPERVETLFAEASGQLALQRRGSSMPGDFGGEPRELDADGEWRAFRAAATERAARPEPLTLDERRAFFDRFRTLLEFSSLSSEPLLWVFDTFEEVQYRSRDFVTAIGTFIGELQGIAPRVRVVVAGRAPVEEFETQPLGLKEFDREAAIGYLVSQGITDEALAERVAAKLGGTPLTLRLAAELLRSEPRGRRSIRDWNVRSMGFLRAKEGEIQAQLYRRILEHIHDADVRRLAHPGLILRRITPELILNVLAKPCGVAVPDLARARHLFGELRREVSLVSLAPDGALEHRGDVRRVMGHLLATDDPRGVRRIHARAIAYYRQFDDPRSRAEEIYHRLARGQAASTIDRRWTPEAAAYLANAYEDLPPPARAYLASHSGADAYIDESVWELVDLPVWERRAIRRANDLIAAGELKKALEVVRQRKERTFASGVYLVEAGLLDRMGDTALAFEVTSRAIEEVSAADDRDALVPLLILDGRIRKRLGDTDHASHVLRHAQRFAAEAGNRLAAMEAAYEKARLRWDLSYGKPYEALEDLSRTFAKLSEREIRQAPELMRRVAAELHHVPVMRKVIEVVGMPSLASWELDVLAAALAEFQQRAGLHDWDLGAGPAPFHGLPRVWRWRIRRLGPPHLDELLIRVFDSARPDTALLDAVATLLRGDGKAAARKPGPTVLFAMEPENEEMAQSYVDALEADGMTVIESYERDDILRRVHEDLPDLLLLEHTIGTPDSEVLGAGIVEAALRRNALRVVLLTAPVPRRLLRRFQDRVGKAEESANRVTWGTDPATLIREVKKQLRHP